ncbi:5-formaminoimidazole-4-carboxamide-1-(beta)-D-ribofuranosyl 5'-monophosphate synthetase [Candidatus Curtissbacteria bacterium RBG_13_40_7]|uniref:5-formaminoimidazole-4-carboxamide-1-(Beta)-D-ribofuranosyl 5'-monophosphate synthetase n=1 Tax=Candidatus Curtissbacteria bacterium RBG_13_40_7 TaxID=1797706 RepID=A0A1F5FU18_9BACT|nr:MAG: 5-formaminoimidazole-4-carboxamide-1-(beta)-D-ribofuranosyl 5'-monophosphate synthetase [Candidatus Curtissbacteria bacterium RBG_13_40_7]
MSKPTIAVIGSHSALDVCRGAKDEGLKTLVIVEKGRDKTYAQYFKSAGSVGCVDEVLYVDKFKDILSKKVQQILKKKNCIFIPHRSFEVYLNDYDAIEKKFNVPMFGNRFLLRLEERTEKPNQYDLLKWAGIQFPRRFTSPKEIDRLVIVKAQQEKVAFERGFFFASSPQDFQREAKKRIASGLISKKGLDDATIEEFVVGTSVNFNFFYSPVNKRLELVGTDTRRQTNLDGFLRLPAPQQIEALKYLEVTFKEMGHTAVTLPESLIEEAMETGESFVKTTQEKFPPGIIGPFALQSLIRPVFPKLEIVVYDVAPRMPGSPGISATPYSNYLYGKSLSMGRRVAMEIKNAYGKKQLQKILT